MRYSALQGAAGLAMQYDTLALAAIQSICSRFVPWSDAALRPAGIQIVLNDIVVNRRCSAVELGSGISTMFIAALLAERGGRLISIDHDMPWITEVKRWLTPAEAATISFVHAPLAPAEFESRSVQWYERSAVVAALASACPIDLVVVDGPPAYREEHCLNRGPALGVLRPYLASAVTILLDDINRTGEQHIARHWSDQLGVPPRDLTIEAGVALWSVGRAHNISQ